MLTPGVRGALALALVLACRGPEGTDGRTAEPDRSGATSEQASSRAGAYDRASFVLCPALEDHRAELAAIVGFEHDPAGSIAGVGSECIIRGTRFGVVRVSLAPAVIRSIAMQVSSYEADAVPAPELGEQAMLVDVSLQPHVVFPLGGLIVDVDAENVETPDHATMIALALRVRELLAAANR
jgi:hypothetical protein